MIKTPKEVVIEGTECNIMKAICDKPMANITLNGKTLRLGIRKGCPLSTVLLNTVLGAIKEKERKGIRIGKEKGKLSLFADDMILVVESISNRIHQNL